jgi:hypothetical protein
MSHARLHYRVTPAIFAVLVIHAEALAEFKGQISCRFGHEARGYSDNPNRQPRDGAPRRSRGQSLEPDGAVGFRAPANGDRIGGGSEVWDPRRAPDGFDLPVSRPHDVIEAGANEVDLSGALQE